MTGQEGYLRPLSFSKDLWQVADLIGEAFAEEIEARGSRVVEEIRTLARTASVFGSIPGWERAIFGNMRGFVWEVDGRIVGTVTIQRGPKSLLVWQVANVAVSEDFRGRGIGQKLVERALEEIVRLGGVDAVLQVRSDNEVAIHIYEKLGFYAIGREVWWKGMIPDDLKAPPMPGPIIPIRAEHESQVYRIARNVTEGTLARAARTDMKALFPSAWERAWERMRGLIDGRRTWRLGVWSCGEMDGWLIVKRRPAKAKKHEMQVLITPISKDHWEVPITAYGLELLRTSPPLPVEIRLANPFEEVESFLSGIGFREDFSLTTMRKSFREEESPFTT